MCRVVGCRQSHRLSSLDLLDQPVKSVCRLCYAPMVRDPDQGWLRAINEGAAEAEM